MILDIFKQTFEQENAATRPLLDIGYFANVIDIGGIGLAITTDGVGTKSILASMLGVYDTIGIDCVAANVNDLLCVGARPVAIVDCLTTFSDYGPFVAPIFEGICTGALEAGVSIVGGETAMAPELFNEKCLGFDLSATAVGTVALDRIIDGSAVCPGDIVVGLRSSGIHANGLTAARQMLFKQYKITDRLRALHKKTLGEELLTPTRIYVKPILALLDAGVEVHALVNITGGGFKNLQRVAAPVGFVLNAMPKPEGVFALLEQVGQLSKAALYSTFNMGIGFCVVVPAVEQERTLEVLTQCGEDPLVIGRANNDKDHLVRLSTSCDDICAVL